MITCSEPFETMKQLAGRRFNVARCLRVGSKGMNLSTSNWPTGISAFRDAGHVSQMYLSIGSCSPSCLHARAAWKMSEVVDRDLQVRQVRLPEGELVLGEGARLVGGEDGHARELLDRREARDDRRLAREGARADGHRRRAHDLHRDWDGGDEEDEAELDGRRDGASRRRRAAGRGRR